VLAATGAGRAGFSPSVLSGGKLWLDSSDGLVKGVGDIVSSWANKYDAANNPTVPAAAEPVVIAAASGINGREVVRFASASSQYLSVNFLASMFTGSDLPHSIFIAHRKTTNPGGTAHSLITASRSSSTTPVHQHYTNSSYNHFRRPDSGGASTPNGSFVLDTNVNIWSIVFSGTEISSWINGAANVSAQAHDVGALTVDRVTIGAWNTTSVLQPANFDLAEILIFNRALSTSERTSLENYLIKRWR